jgi:hypothetical protein
MGFHLLGGWQWATRKVRARFSQGRLHHFSLILASPIKSPITGIGPTVSGRAGGWMADLLLFGAYMAFSLLLLVAFGRGFDKVLLPSTTVQNEVEVDRNVAGICISAAVNVLVALIIAAAL